MASLVYMNGKLQPLEKAQVSVFDASYLYGEGLFETLLAVQGKVLFCDHHLTRLYQSARILKIPVPFSKERMKKEITRTLKANRLSDAYIRINLSTQEETIGARLRKSKRANILIFVKPIKPYPDSLYRKGGKLILIRSIRNDPLPLSGLKTTNYLSKFIARREIQRRKAIEGVLLNQFGRVTECASSNLFIVKDGILLTPPLSEGLLPGVTREVLIKLARKNRIPCKEKRLSLSELKKSDEIFITSTLKGVLPIANFEGIRKRAPGPVTRRLGSFYESIR